MANMNLAESQPAPGPGPSGSALVNSAGDQLGAVVADQAQAEADAARRRDDLAARPGEGLVAGSVGGHTNEPVTPPDGPASGLHWMGT